MMSKRILLITFSNISDHQDKVVVLFEEMKKAGVDVYLMLPETIDVECPKSNQTWFVKCPDRPGIAKGTFNIKNLLSMVNRVKKGKFDYIVFESLHVWNLPLMIILGKHTKKYQMIHDVIPHGGDKTARQVDLMNKTVCKLANKILICNSKYKDDLCQRYRVPSNRVVTVGLWERYPKYKATSNSGTMLFFGRLNPYKGADNLLEIARRCPKTKFEIVGKADSQVTDIIDELRRLPNVSVDERFIADDEIADVFYNSGWVVLPYNSATQSGVVVESYKHSKPVISFDVGAISEQVENGKTGYLIKSGDIDDFVQKIIEVKNITDDEYASFCEDAYQYGYEKFSPQKVANKLMELCQ